MDRLERWMSSWPGWANAVMLITFWLSMAAFAWRQYRWIAMKRDLSQSGERMQGRVERWGVNNSRVVFTSPDGIERRFNTFGHFEIGSSIDIAYDRERPQRAEAVTNLGVDRRRDWGPFWVFVVGFGMGWFFFSLWILELVR